MDDKIRKTAPLPSASDTPVDESLPPFESDSRLLNTFEQAAVGIAHLDLNLRFLRVNNRYCELVGYSKAELKNMTPLDFTHPDDMSLKVDFSQTLLSREKKSASIEKRYICKDGHIQWVDVTSCLVRDRDDSPEYYMAVVQDINERKLAEENLQRLHDSLVESEERFRSTFEQAAVGIAHVDLDGRFLRANDRFCALTGFSRDEITGIRFQDITHPDDLDADVHLTARLFQDEIKTYTIEKRYIRKDGGIQWINLTGSLVRNGDGSPKYFIAVAQDISDRKETEMRVMRLHEHLSESEERFRSTFEQAAVGIAHCDPDGKLIRMNGKFCAMLGYEADELTRMTPHDITHPDDQPDSLRQIQLLLQGQLTSVIMEKRYLRKNGTIQWVEVYKSVVRDSQGHIKYVIIVCLDISERKQFQSQLIRLNENLEALVIERTTELTETNKALEETVAELKASRSELRNLSRHLHFLQEEERKRIAHEIHDELGQMLAVMKIELHQFREKGLTHVEASREKISSLMDIVDRTVMNLRRVSSELRPTILEDLGLQAALEWLCSDLAKRTGLKLNLNYHVPEPGPRPEQATGLFRIVQEAVTNALKHSGSPRIDVALEQTGHEYRLMVKDFGKGLPRDFMQGGGSLGLVGMRERALSLGGTFQVRANKPQGTIIEVKAPLYAESAA